MTVESNYVIAIATLRDWLKRLAPVFQPMRIKTKTKRVTDRAVFKWLSKNQNQSNYKANQKRKRLPLVANHGAIEFTW